MAASNRPNSHRRPNGGGNEDQEAVPMKRPRKTMILKLLTSDETEFPVPADIAKVSVMLSTLIEDMKYEDPDDPRLQEPIPLDISEAMMRKVLDFCRRYQDFPYVPRNLRKTRIVQLDDWDMEYMDVDEKTFGDLFNAANYLNVPGLMEILAQKVANSMNDFTVEELRSAFGEKNDFTPQEEADLKQQYEWAERWNFEK